MPLATVALRDRNVRVQRVLIGLLVANLAVVGAKFVIAWRTGSLGVLGDAVHSSVDAMNNVLALAVIWVAAREPDEDHPYGHEKFETLGALAIVVFLSITGFELVKGAVGRLASGGVALDVGALELSLLVGTLAVNTGVAVYESRRGRALNSELLLADAAHTRADVFITVGVLVGVLAAREGYWYVDPIMALIVAVAIVVIAYGIVARSVPVLVDEHAEPADAIQVAAESVDGVIRAYDIRSRGAHHRRFAEVTIAVRRDQTVDGAHRIADAVELRLRRELQLHEIVVHVEPC
ncbi:MAG: cation diffusion facilitator family transporter [Gemmatimonadales bacterium]|jgi:cation diffusion facilitator family transporter